MNALTQEEKVAMFLGSLAPSVRDSVLAKLAPERRSKLRPLLQSQPRGPSAERLDPVLRELERALSDDEANSGGATQPSAAARVASAYSAGSAAAKQNSEETAGADVNPMDALSSVKPDDLASALKGENPRTVSLILNSLPVDQAGQIFKRLAGDLRREVSAHFASMTAPNPEVVERIVEAVVRKSRQLKEKPPEPAPDVRYGTMAKMTRLLEKAQRAEVLSALEEHDPAAAAAVKGLLYSFEDILRIENRSLQRLLGELDAKNLAVALKGAEPAIKEKVLANMSQRAQERLNEEIELGAAASPTQVNAARKVIADAIQKLDQAGELVMT